MKLFVLLLVIVLFILWKKNKNKKDALMKGPQASPQGLEQVDELIACCVCGIHVPKSQLVLVAHDQYQCAKHR